MSGTSRRAFLAATGVAASGLAGCLGGTDGAGAGGSGDEGGTASPTGTTTGTPIPGESSLLLNWKPSGLHVPYFAAKANGFYEEEGLTLGEIRTGEGSTFSAKQTGLGNVDFAVTSSDQVLNVNSRDLSPLSVGVVMQKSPAVVFSTREAFGGELTSPDQLAGKTVGTGPGMVRMLTSLLLEDAGVREDVEMVDTGYDTVQQLLSGEIDAAGGVFGDAISAEAQGYTVDSLAVGDSIPSYGHVIATNREWAGDNSEAVRAFLRGTARGAAWAHQRPGEATDLLVDANGVLEESRDQQQQKWERMADGFMTGDAVADHGWGWSESEPWQVVHDALAGADALGGEVDPASVWTNEYLDTDSRFVGSYTDVI
ncbi:ABC transporter substrate-binding protein [Haloplanus rubicundus]|uniref:Thiamine pyrimidine synthase n=1 Tax=Haloplanus rubicundus TaxID=1547898 RepID=A0A345EH03_9EURY|nr:ABC transporter substrate-binding protein [Haloplanus rubicundus]AXG11475.1 myristoyl transferase [Haloplanus rubicundus]